MSMTLQTPMPVASDSHLVLNGIRWEQYRAISDALQDRPGLRMTFLNGRLTLLSPSPRHDWHEHALSHIVAAVATGLGMEWEPAGHATYQRADQEVGVEGDHAYYFGANADLMRGPVDVDLTTQPPPDLVIEVKASHRADDSVAVWGRLGVPEVWRLDIARWSLTFGIRREDGTYAPVPRSLGLSPIEPADLIEQLKLAEQLGASRWYRRLDGWVRATLLPRREPGPDRETP